MLALQAGKTHGMQLLGWGCGGWLAAEISSDLHAHAAHSTPLHHWQVVHPGKCLNLSPADPPHLMTPPLMRHTGGRSGLACSRPVLALVYCSIASHIRSARFVSPLRTCRWHSWGKVEGGD